MNTSRAGAGNMKTKRTKIINENKTLPSLARNMKYDLDELKKIISNSN